MKLNILGLSAASSQREQADNEVHRSYGTLIYYEMQFVKNEVK